MNTALLIARRYLFSKKKRNFINIISIVSVFGVAIGTAAMVIVLSVFNGLEDFTRSLYSSYHADLEITPVKGKSFAADSVLLARLARIEGVKAVTEVIADDALLRYKDAQIVVKVKGLAANFDQQYPLREKLVGGNFALWQQKTPRAMIGVGVQLQLGIDLGDDMEPLVFWYPRKDKQVNMADPSKNFEQRIILPGGVLAIEQQFDQNHVLVPIEWAEDLMQYKGRRTSIEVKVWKKSDIAAVQHAIRSMIDADNLQVKNSEEQQESIMRAIRIEKLFVFVALAFVLAIASFNIFFTLSMLAIEKQHDIAVLTAMGASAGIIRRIFLTEGFFIAWIGAFSGMVLGFVICFLQMQFGFVSLGIQSSVIQAYPVQMKWADFLSISVLVFAITVLASYAPARRAAAVKVSEML
ncbi:FtsX-like permease family protein [Rhodoflexus caldus]|uniref:FtsX-like permease family protein n=1 Tax=Rhodoflexus caldus TaxID=2891236 RepID=UPI00202A473D|nr:FtsX-like permease family protein [Rhodoflexus caldus]